MSQPKEQIKQIKQKENKKRLFFSLWHESYKDMRTIPSVLQLPVCLKQTQATPTLMSIMDVGQFGCTCTQLPTQGYRQTTLVCANPCADRKVCASFWGYAFKCID